MAAEAVKIRPTEKKIERRFKRRVCCDE